MQPTRGQDRRLSELDKADVVEEEAQLGERYFLVTQNVDGLHARAGSRRMVALHGELFESRCERCNEPFADEQTYLAEPLPRCEKCNGLIRPHIVWFGEILNYEHLRAVSNFIYAAGESLIFMAVGTSGQVYPAAGIVDEVNAAGGTSWLIDVDPSPEYAHRFDEVVSGKSGEVLPKLFGLE